MKDGESGREQACLLSGLWSAEARRAELCMLKYASFPSFLLTCPKSSWQASRRVTLAAAATATGMFEGCYVLVGKFREGGGCQAEKGMWRQMAVRTSSNCLCGEQHVGGSTTRICSPQTDRLDYPCGALSYNHHPCPCNIMPAWVGHTNTDLLMCCISSFYTLVSIWDFYGCSGPFRLFCDCLGGFVTVIRHGRFGWENSV